MPIRAQATPVVLQYGPASLGFSWGGAWFYVSAFSWWEAVLDDLPLEVYRRLEPWEPLFRPRILP